MFRRIFFIFVAALLFSQPARAGRTDGIAAVVNDDIVTLSELRNRVLPAAERAGAAEGDGLFERLRTRELWMLVEEMLIAQKAAGMGVSASPEDVEKEFVQMRESFPSVEAFSLFLEQQNMTEKILRDKLASRVLLARIAEREIMPGISRPDTEEARRFYSENIEMFTEPPLYRLSRIFVRTGEGVSIAEAEEKIGELADKISAGGDFRQLAREYSDGPEASGGGDLGLVRGEELPPQAAAEVGALSPGGVSGPVRTDRGFSIFKLYGAAGGRRMDYSEVEEIIMRHLFQKKAEAAAAAWLERVKAEAYIEFRL